MYVLQWIQLASDDGITIATQGHLLIRVTQILQRDQEGKEKAPEIIKEENDISVKGGSAEETTFANLLALGQLENAANGEPLGHKFGLPTLPLPSNANLHYRYDPVVDQVTNLLMQHGKLGVAQRVGLVSSFSLSGNALLKHELPCRIKFSIIVYGLLTGF
jgi:hypothetical protein